MKIMAFDEHDEGAREQKTILQKGHIAICPKTKRKHPGRCPPYMHLLSPRVLF